MLLHLRLLLTLVVVATTAQLGVPDTLFASEPMHESGPGPVGETGEEQKLDDDSEDSATLHDGEAGSQTMSRAMFADVDPVHDCEYRELIDRPPIVY